MAGFLHCHIASTGFRRTTVVFLVCLTAFPVGRGQFSQAALSRARLHMAPSRHLARFTSPDAITTQLVTLYKHLRDDGASTYYNYGTSLALSGDLLAVGATGISYLDYSEPGFVALYGRHQGGPNRWGLIKKLFASGDGPIDYVGSALALDGETLVVSAQAHVYIFERHQGGPD
jgi:hypothetical protein